MSSRCRASQLGIRRSKGGVVVQARRLFLRAYTRGWWGLPGGDYSDMADWLTAEGYPTSINDIKNAKRAKAPIDHAIPANAPGIAQFLDSVLGRFPTFEWRRLVDGKVRGLEEKPHPRAA